MRSIASRPRPASRRNPLAVIAGNSAGREGEQARSDLKRPWAAVAKRAGLDGVRIHDLRHTHASVGAGAGLGLPIIGKLLGHAQANTTARYAHLDADPLRRASDRIGSHIAAAMGDTKPSDAPLLEQLVPAADRVVRSTAGHPRLPGNSTRRPTKPGRSHVASPETQPTHRGPARSAYCDPLH